MEFLRDTNFDFMKYRKFWVVVSLILVGVGIFSVFFHGKLNVGVDFAGGTQITLKFRDQPNVEQLRSVLGAQGIADAQIQRFGEEGDNEVIIKTRLAEGSEEGRSEQVLAALDRQYNAGRGGKPDLNRIGTEAVEAILRQANPDKVGGDTAPHYEAVAKSILDKRKEVGLFKAWNELSGLPGVSPAAVSALQGQTVLGGFTMIGVENVGPQIGGELRRQGFWAVALSLVGMLIYIWIRFELRFGVGAVMACLHDVLVTLGFYALAGFEFNLTTVAAFLTLIGYSVNDTVVIFDRVRENMRKNRRKPLIETLNESINQTLSRTILTGGSSLLALFALLVWGGDVIRGFAFVLVIGILVGTYSSIYVASPFTLLWERYFGSKGGRITRGGPSPAVTADTTPPARTTGGEARRPAARRRA